MIPILLLSFSLLENPIVKTSHSGQFKSYVLKDELYNIYKAKVVTETLSVQDINNNDAAVSRTLTFLKIVTDDVVDAFIIELEDGDSYSTCRSMKIDNQYVRNPQYREAYTYNPPSYLYEVGSSIQPSDSCFKLREPYTWYAPGLPILRDNSGKFLSYNPMYESGLVVSNDATEMTNLFSIFELTPLVRLLHSHHLFHRFRRLLFHLLHYRLFLPLCYRLLHQSLRHLLHHHHSSHHPHYLRRLLRRIQNHVLLLLFPHHPSFLHLLLHLLRPPVLLPVLRPQSSSHSSSTLSPPSLPPSSPPNGPPRLHCLSLQSLLLHHPLPHLPLLLPHLLPCLPHLLLHPLLLPRPHLLSHPHNRPRHPHLPPLRRLPLFRRPRLLGIQTLPSMKPSSFMREGST